MAKYYDRDTKLAYVEPVSYTHLDVYKRQVLVYPAGLWYCSNPRSKGLIWWIPGGRITVFMNNLHKRKTSGTGSQE